MLLKRIVFVIASLGVIFWWISRQNVPDPTPAGQDSNSSQNQDENKDELADSQAAEVVATWNLLHPPS